MAQTQKRFYYHGMEVRRLFYNGKEVSMAFRSKRRVHTDVFSNLLIFYRDEDYCVKFSTTASGGMTLATSTGGKAWNGTMWYSTDKVDWTVWDGSEIRVLADPETDLYIKGKGNTYVAGPSGGNSWKITGNISGNLECLLDYTVVASEKHPEMANYAFDSIFMGDSHLYGEVLLPATTLTPHCYAHSFASTGVIVRELPATEIPEYAYLCMFKLNSSSFYDSSTGKHYPVLKATSLSTSSCESMFYSCYNMSNAPSGMSDITRVGSDSCYNMFAYCSNLVCMPSLYGVYGNYLPLNCFAHMFDGCSKLPIYTYRYQGCQTPVKFSYPDYDGSKPLEDMFKGTLGNAPDTPLNATEYYTETLIS